MVSALITSRNSSFDSGSDQARFVVEIIGGSARLKFSRTLVFDDLRDAAGYVLRDILRHDAGLGEHDDGGLVDLIEKFHRAAAAAESGIDIEAGAGQSVDFPLAKISIKSYTYVIFGLAGTHLPILHKLHVQRLLKKTIPPPGD